jgi:hypothetical protein
MGKRTKEGGKEKKKGGFFRKLFRVAALAGIVAGITQFVKRRRAGDVDAGEWQELPPPTT